jgi:hypothetical protein
MLFHVECDLCGFYLDSWINESGSYDFMINEMDLIKNVIYLI